MSALAEAPTTTRKVTELQLVTFNVGPLLLGLSIEQIQEINRNLDVTLVPHAPEFVRGVINLRGNVVTVIDLRTVWGLPAGQVTRQSRNLVVKTRGEQIGLWVDRILDTLIIRSDEIEPAPANIDGVDGRFFEGVYSTPTDVVVIARLDELLAMA